jgi:hypothetical protein
MGAGASTSFHLPSQDLPPIRFINFKDFKALDTFPRYPENEDVALDMECIGRLKRETSLIVFISHCWLRGWAGAEGWDGRPHPDNATGDKYKLCVAGIEMIMKTLAPGMEECYIWLDFGCIDQNGDPAGELKQLDKIVEICDCILTPIYDKDHDKWALPSPFQNIFEDYKSTPWNGNNYSYLSRGWCRVEMFYAANIPLIEDSEERRGKMKAGLLSHRMEGRRPHLLYGSKEKSQNWPPMVLPPLQNSYFEAYNPETGSLTKAEDRDKIQSLVNELRPYMKRVKVGYEGEWEDGKHNGKGKYVYADGTVYEGDWKDGKQHGKGRFVYADGAFYEGDCEDDKKHGKGKYVYANGNIYEGDWKDGMQHGKGKYVYATDIYEGDFEDGKKHGKGKYVYADGAIYEGDWKDGKQHGKGRYVTASGDVYEGDYEDGKKHGKAKNVYADGAVYEGDWKNGKKHGRGKYMYADGDVYEGDYEDGNQHGRGKYMYANGNVYEGDWNDCNLHGKGRYVTASGDVYEGDFEDGKMHGRGRYVYANGNVYEGDWKGGKHHGRGKYVYHTGAVYEGDYEDGKMHGRGKYMHANGNVYEGDWKKGKQI